MKDVIALFRRVVVQIATPYSTGTGFLVPEYGLVVTNEHVVRDNREVVVFGEQLEKTMAPVVYIDQRFDLAFLRLESFPDLPPLLMRSTPPLKHGEAVIAVGHPFGLQFTATQGIVSNIEHEQNEIPYVQHDAALNPGNSGGPLLDKEGRIVGVNTFIFREGSSIGFSLPAEQLMRSLKEYQEGGREEGCRCASCLNVVFRQQLNGRYCPHCGAQVMLPSQAEMYEPLGVARTLEDMLQSAGYDVRLSRRGPNNWEILRGSARITISYHDRTGLITGDAYLCLLPREDIKPIYEYLLRQNLEVEGLTLSIKGQDIVLSLLIYDRYLDVDTGLELFDHLFERADYYDNILVEEYGALWKYEEETEN